MILINIFSVIGRAFRKTRALYRRMQYAMDWNATISFEELNSPESGFAVRRVDRRDAT